METTFPDQHGRDFLFSKAIKAGSRVYYLDVKRCSTGDVMMSITESRKLSTGDVGDEKPTFERHRVFVYQEDLVRFKEMFDEAMSFVIDGNLLPPTSPKE